MLKELNEWLFSIEYIMYGKVLIVFEGDNKSHNKNDSSDNDKDPFAFSSKDDKAPQAKRRKKDFNAKMRRHSQLEFAI